MTYHFDVVMERKNTNCYKWDRCAILPKDEKNSLIPMWIADMDFPCGEPIINAIHRCTDQLVMGYTDYSEELREAVRSFYSRHFGWDIDRNSLYFMNGVVPSVGVAVRAYTDPGDGVIVQTPVYNPFFNEVENNKRTLVASPMKLENGVFTMDFEALERDCADPANKMLILCSPQNPTGRVWTKEELQQVLDICRRHGIVLVSDEIHCDLLRRGVVHTPLLTMATREDLVVLFNAPSKTFNIPGLQMSNVIICNEELRRRWEAVAPHLMPNPLSQAGAVAAYTHCDDWLDQLITYLDDNFALLEEYLHQHFPKCQYKIPEGTYLAWVNFAPYMEDSGLLQRGLAEDTGVFVTDGAVYRGEGWVRLNLGCAKSVLLEALERMNQWIRGDIKE